MASGDIFGFYVASTDGIFGAGIATIYNFSGPGSQSNPGSTDVPAPAAVLGVLAAFGWSRKLRRRSLLVLGRRRRSYLHPYRDWIPTSLTGCHIPNHQQPKAQANSLHRRCSFLQILSRVFRNSPSLKGRARSRLVNALLIHQTQLEQSPVEVLHGTSCCTPPSSALYASCSDTPS